MYDTNFINKRREIVNFETRVYLKREYYPFEGYKWVAIFVGDDHGSRVTINRTKKAAAEYCRSRGLRVVRG